MTDYKTHDMLCNMKVNKAYKYRIYPNRAQRVILEKHFGCTRFVYNYFLRQRIDWYAEHENDKKKGLNYHDTAAMLTQLKKQEEYSWLREVNSQSLQQSLRHLDIAYSSFFNNRAKFPRFKKRRYAQSFSIPQRWSLLDDRLNIPGARGIKIKCHRPIEGIMKSVTISRSASGRYYAAILCEVEMSEPEYTGSEIGIDFGIKAFLTTSDGEVVQSPKYLRRAEKRLKRLQRSVSRKQKGSNSRCNATHRLAVQHEKVSNQRSDFLHKTSRRLVSDNQAIHIEDLAIRNMIRNHSLAKSISDAGWNQFVNMLQYKGKWYGCSIGKLDRFFPSSKRCYSCGYINGTLTLKDREWQCPECDTVHDRDLNAARNILTFSRAGTARSQAGGER